MIFTLCCLENMKYQEVADKLGISINTVRTQMTRAFKSLRDTLSGKTFTSILFVRCQFVDMLVVYMPMYFFF